MSVWIVHLNDTSMFFRVVSSTGRSFVRKARMESCISHVSSIDRVETCRSGGVSGMCDILALDLVGLVEVEEALELLWWPG